VAPAVQAKLLRVMQEKEFLPLGALENRTVDVRILAATNEDIRELVAEDRFREDLFYRLNVLSITIPPLRERMDDLPMLVAHFLDRYNDANDKQVEGVATEVMERFLSYSWPGNVRELENVIERGVVLAQQPEITLDLMPQEFQAAAALPATAALPEGMDLGQALAGLERQLIESALRRTDGVQKRAAAILGLKPTTLNEKIKRLKIRV